MNKKLKFLFISLFSLILNTVLYTLRIDLNVVFTLLVIIMYSLLSLVVFKRSYKIISEGKKKLLFLGTFLVMQGLFLYVFPSLGNLPVLAYSITMAFWIYFLLLSINVFIVSENLGEEIPLIEPSKVIVFISYLLNIFIGATLIYKFYISPTMPFVSLLVDLFLFLVLFGSTIYTLDWLLKAYRVGDLKNKELNMINAFVLLSTLLFSAYSLMIYPFETFASALVITTIFYVGVNYIITYSLHKLNFKFYLEILLIVFSAFIAAILI